jgi:CBS domain-containing protein
MDDLTAADIMTTHVVTVTPDTTLGAVAELLVAHHISGVPVVEPDGTLVGILSETDLIDENKRRVKLPRTALFGVVLLPEALIREAWDEGNDLCAADLMSKRVFSLTEEAPAREVAGEMLSRKINRIPITRDGRLVGIITRSDLLRAVQAHWQKPSS